MIILPVQLHSRIKSIQTEVQLPSVAVCCTNSKLHPTSDTREIYPHRTPRTYHPTIQRPDATRLLQLLPANSNPHLAQAPSAKPAADSKNAQRRLGKCASMRSSTALILATSASTLFTEAIFAFTATAISSPSWNVVSLTMCSTSG